MHVLDDKTALPERLKAPNLVSEVNHNIEKGRL